MTRRRYPWELGTQLAAEIQARDLPAAQRTIARLTNVIGEQSASRSFDEVKLRMLQILTIANRAAYYAGANPDRLFRANITLVYRILKVGTQKQLEALARWTCRTFIALVPDRNIVNAGKLDEAMKYIREHCTENLSRKTVAKILGCSPSHLSELFSTITGHTFKQVLLKYRMDKAKDLLRQTGKTVTQVAFEVGYGDPNYFSAAFRRVTGITPRQYRTTAPEAGRSNLT